MYVDSDKCKITRQLFEILAGCPPNSGRYHPQCCSLGVYNPVEYARIPQLRWRGRSIYSLRVIEYSKFSSVLSLSSIVFSIMKYTTLITLLLCFGLLISALPLPQQFSHRAIQQRQYIFDRRSSQDPGNNTNERRVKTPTPEDDPNVPVLGATGTYYDEKENLVWAYYGDSLRQHAVHIMLSQHLNPTTRLPMKRASAEEHRRNRIEALKNIPTRPNMARDEKPVAMLKRPRGVKPTVMGVSAEESSELYFYCL